MKKGFILTIMCFLTLSTAFASFPVQKKSAEVIEATDKDVSLESTSDVSANEISSNEVVADAPISPAVASGGYNMWVAAALCWFLGIVAAHRWYAKKPVGWNILFILTLGGLGIWWLIDLITILTGSFDN